MLMRRLLPLAVLACVAALPASGGFMGRGGTSNIVSGGGGVTISPLSVSFENTSGSATSSSYVTVGQPFKAGDLQPADSLILDCSASGGSPSIYVQKDNLATHLNGSVRHAALTAIIPGISASSTKGCEWKIGTGTAPASAAPTIAQVLASSYDVAINFTAFFIPTSTTLASAYGGGNCPGGTHCTQVTCVNASGESTPSTSVNLTAGATLNRPICTSGFTGWNYYINAHKQNGSPVSSATASVTVPTTPTTSGAAPPSTNTASLGISESTNCKTILSAANTAGTVRTFISGPAVKEYIAIGTVNSGNLRIRCHIRAYADGQFQTDVIFDNTWFNEVRSSQYYNVNIVQNGSTVYTINQVNQWLHSLWHRRISTSGLVKEVEDYGPLNVKHNYAYLRDAGVLPAYDTTYGTDLTTTYNESIASRFNALFATQPAPMGQGFLATGMPDGGGRADLGPQPNWVIQWALSGDYRARVITMMQSDAFNSAPFTNSDSSSGLPLPIDARTNGSDPNGPLIVSGIPGVSCRPKIAFCTGDGANGYGQWGSPWVPDVAHVPDTHYLPYVLTASPYRLISMQGEANWLLTSAYSFGLYFDIATGTIHEWSYNGYRNSGEVRQQAIQLRNLSEAAAFTPDADSLKSYFVQIVDDEYRSVWSDFVGSTNLTGIFGEIEGFALGSGRGAIFIMDVYTDMMTTQSLHLNPTTNTAVKGRELLDWHVIYQNNLFLKGNPSGTLGDFPSLGATAYKLWTCITDSAGSNLCAGNTPITTWSQYNSINTYPSWIPGASQKLPTPLSPPMINFACCGPTVAGGTAGTMGGYSESAAAAAAMVYRITQNPDSLHVWAHALARSLQAYTLSLPLGGLGSVAAGLASWENDVRINPFNIMSPQLPNGNYGPTWNHFQISISDTNPVKTAVTGDSFVFCVDPVTSCTVQGGSGAGTNNVLMVDALNAGIVGNLYAGAGENNFMFGAWGGTNLFKDHTGNNYMWGSPISGTNTFEFGGQSSTNSGQDTVVNFRPGTDTIKIKTNLDGSGVTTAAQVAALCATSGSDTVCSFGGGNTITIKANTGPLSSWFTIF